MRYQITHKTHYKYTERVAICQNQLRMRPSSRAHVQVHRTDSQIDPVPDTLVHHIDYFGNHVESFAIESLHQELKLTVKSDVTVSANEMPEKEKVPSWEDIVSMVRARSDDATHAAGEFCFDSPRIHTEPALAQYARESFPPGRSIVDASVDFTERIHRDFRYDTSATHVNTQAAESFTLRAGVCQDFAHVQIGCLRSLGLPARYVSGYLRTHPPKDKPRLVGVDQSHAWISVYAGSSMGWIDLDPTNACLVGTDHIPICIGRDYGDVTPMRGVILGGGQTTLNISVDVAPVP